METGTTTPYVNAKISLDTTATPYKNMYPMKIATTAPFVADFSLRYDVNDGSVSYALYNFVVEMCGAETLTC